MNYRCRYYQTDLANLDKGGQLACESFAPPIASKRLLAASLGRRSLKGFVEGERDDSGPTCPHRLGLRRRPRAQVQRVGDPSEFPRRYRGEQCDKCVKEFRLRATDSRRIGVAGLSRNWLVGPVLRHSTLPIQSAHSARSAIQLGSEKLRGKIVWV